MVQEVLLFNFYLAVFDSLSLQIEMSHEIPCKFFMSGFCRAGSRCNFSHQTGNSSAPSNPIFGRSVFLRNVDNQGSSISSSVFGKPSSTFDGQTSNNRNQSVSSSGSSVFGQTPFFSLPSGGQQSAVSVFEKPRQLSSTEIRNVTPLKNNDNTLHNSSPNFTSTPHTVFGKPSNGSKPSSIFGNSTSSLAAPFQQPASSGNSKASMPSTNTSKDATVKNEVCSKQSKNQYPENISQRTEKLTDSKPTVGSTKMLFGKVVDNSQQYSIKHAKTFSLVENLSADEVTAFESENFVLGSVPLNPPPIHLC